MITAACFPISNGDAAGPRPSERHEFVSCRFVGVSPQNSALPASPQQSRTSGELSDFSNQSPTGEPAALRGCRARSRGRAVQVADLVRSQVGSQLPLDGGRGLHRTISELKPQEWWRVPPSSLGHGADRRRTTTRTRTGSNLASSSGCVDELSSLRKRWRLPGAQTPSNTAHRGRPRDGWRKSCRSLFPRAPRRGRSTSSALGGRSQGWRQRHSRSQQTRRRNAPSAMVHRSARIAPQRGRAWRGTGSVGGVMVLASASAARDGSPSDPPRPK